jgi:hypothetical protein
MPGDAGLLKQLRTFFETPEPPDLGSDPRAGVLPEKVLNSKLSAILKSSSVANQELLRALILLWHDHCDSAHSIAQAIENPNGAYLHGIVHRREPDYWNSKYWFRQIGQHPALAIIGSRLRAEANSSPSPRDIDRLTPSGLFDPMAMVDACEQSENAGPKAPERSWLRKVQQIESEVLLELFAA